MRIESSDGMPMPHTPIPPLTELPGAPNFTAFLKRELGELIIQGPQISATGHPDLSTIVYPIKIVATELRKYLFVVQKGTEGTKIINVFYRGILPKREGKKTVYAIADYHVSVAGLLPFDHEEPFKKYKRQDFFKEVPFP